MIFTGFDDVPFLTEVEMEGKGRRGRDVGKEVCCCGRSADECASGRAPDLDVAGTEASGDDRAGACCFGRAGRWLNAGAVDVCVRVAGRCVVASSWWCCCGG